MSIVLITGPQGSGKTIVANALRNSAIAFGRGALLVDETTEGEVPQLLEKILAGVALQPEVPAVDQAWKPSCAVILVGERAAILEDFEVAAPGFAALHGPIFTVTTGRDQ